MTPVLSSNLIPVATTLKTDGKQNQGFLDLTERQIKPKLQTWMSVEWLQPEAEEDVYKLKSVLMMLWVNKGPQRVRAGRSFNLISRLLACHISDSRNSASLLTHWNHDLNIIRVREIEKTTIANVDLLTRLGGIVRLRQTIKSIRVLWMILSSPLWKAPDLFIERRRKLRGNS